MRLVLYAVLGIVAYLVLTRWWELLLEWVRPFEVRGIKSAQLRMLFTDLYRRGLDGAEMIVTAEGAGATLTLRKELIGPEGIRLYLILGEVSPASDGGDINHARKALRAVLARHGGERNLGIQPWTKSLGNVAYCGDSAANAAALATDVLHHMYGLADDAEYRIHVRGQIYLWDKLVTNAARPSLRDWPMIVRRTIALGRPYKRSHQPQKYTLFGVVGLRPAVAWLKAIVRGPKAPGTPDETRDRDGGTGR